ncbi:MAG: triose-phosphate isomerase [Salinisphaera sp.]|jgi:triosephosphate isomerase|nr:triose-phosphate isomerase [Salinisphaera sp.]
MPEAIPKRPRLIGVSLKMYFDVARTLAWSKEVAAIAGRHSALAGGQTSLLVLPSLPVLAKTVDIFADTPVQLGAQDLFWEDRGAFTGAVSGADLAQIGCRYVEVGHAERRALFGDDDAAVRLKTAAAVRNGLIPLLCIGEQEQGSVQDAGDACVAQLESALDQFDTVEGRVAVAVAYEPVWAIGQAEAASAEHVIAVSRRIRAWLRERPLLAGAALIYGGSAGPGTLAQLNDAVDGLFLGRFAHDPDALSTILDEARRLE